MRRYIPAAILIVIFSALTVSSMAYNSATCDEIAHHIPSGYVFLTKGDFRMDTAHPPLARYIMALPLKLFMNPNLPDDKSVWRADNRALFGRDFFYRYNNDSKRMLYLGRIAIMSIGILCAILLFVWAKAAYGYHAAYLSLFLYSLSPDIIANSSLATTDMAAAFFIFLSAYTFWLFMKNPSATNMFSSGFCLGLAQLSKYTAIFLYPLFLLAILMPKRGLFGKYAAIVLISLVVTWAGYGFDLQPILKDTMRAEEKTSVAHNIAKKLCPGISRKQIDSIDRFLFNTPMPMGTHALGVMGVFRHGHEGHRTYFMGKWSGKGHPLYFITSFLVKTPIPLIIFFLGGLFLSFREGIGKQEVYFITIICFFTLVSSFSNLQIGIRHLLPVYPFIFMLAGRNVIFFRDKALKYLAILLLAFSVYAAISAWPHYLGYFNEFAGGPAGGYKILRDSNIDWGQDLPALSRYLSDKGIKEVVLLYFGEADPVAYGVKFRNFNEGEMKSPGGNVYAVSVNNLEDVEWAKGYKPTIIAGSSIFVYDFRRKDIK